MQIKERAVKAQTTMEQFLKRVLPAMDLIGVIVVATGCGIEIATHADVGYQLITSGSIIVAGGSFLWAKVYKK